MRACGGVAGSGAELIRVVGVEGMSSDQLEAHRLEVTGASEKNALGKGREDG